MSMYIDAVLRQPKLCWIKCTFDWSPEVAAKESAPLQMAARDNILDALR